MLSMAGLLCSTEPERVASSQDAWWPSPGQRALLEQREAVQHQRHLQGDQNPMDSQGNSREAWDNQGLPSPLDRSHSSSPEMDFQYCEPSMSPPLHPSKRHAPNPPPVSNQATKGLDSFHLFTPRTVLIAVIKAWPIFSRQAAQKRHGHSQAETGEDPETQQTQPRLRVGQRRLHGRVLKFTNKSISYGTGRQESTTTEQITTDETERKKTKPPRHAFTVPRRQGIRLGLSRRTTSQAHSEPTGGGAETAFGKPRVKRRSQTSEDEGRPSASSHLRANLFHVWRITPGAKEEGNFAMVLFVCIFLFMRIPPCHHRHPPPRPPPCL